MTAEAKIRGARSKDLVYMLAMTKKSTARRIIRSPSPLLRRSNKFPLKAIISRSSSIHVPVQHEDPRSSAWEGPDDASKPLAVAKIIGAGLPSGVLTSAVYPTQVGIAATAGLARADHGAVEIDDLIRGCVRVRRASASEGVLSIAARPDFSRTRSPRPVYPNGPGSRARAIDICASVYPYPRDTPRPSISRPGGSTMVRAAISMKRAYTAPMDSWPVRQTSYGRQPGVNVA
ncbi:hypothetical protein LTR53_001932 [Teratosphaeriaceae sp. CCFEE 6253]|nr:hypothetical protein LTR53_001932 [Teratosphaeriaceae sp. CCFEE 6253]